MSRWISAVQNGKRRFGEPAEVWKQRVARPCSSNGPYVLVEPIAALLAPVVELIGCAGVADLAGMSARSISIIVTREQRLITWQRADRLITDVLDDPSLWYSTPGLELRRLNGKVIAQ